MQGIIQIFSTKPTKATVFFQDWVFQKSNYILGADNSLRHLRVRTRTGWNRDAPTLSPEGTTSYKSIRHISDTPFAQISQGQGVNIIFATPTSLDSLPLVSSSSYLTPSTIPASQCTISTTSSPWPLRQVSENPCGQCSVCPPAVTGKAYVTQILT